MHEHLRSYVYLSRASMYVMVKAEIRWMYISTGDFVHLTKWPEKFNTALSLPNRMLTQFCHYICEHVLYAMLKNVNKVWASSASICGPQ
jgi:hypothetical protein